MNKLLSTMLLTAILLSLVSCNSDRLDHDQNSGDLIDVNLTISTKAPSTDPESQVKSLRVYAFNGNKLTGFYMADPTKLEGNSHTFTMHLRNDAITDFYIIANEKAAGELKVKNNKIYTLSDKADTSDLNNLTFSQLPNDVSNTGLPMSAIYRTTIHKNTPVNIDNIKRAVAKLNLYFTKKGEGDVYVSRGTYLYNAPAYGYLFPKAYDGTDYLHMENDRIQGAENHQDNGRIILNSGWPADSYNGKQDIAASTVSPDVKTKTGINKIEVPFTSSQIPSEYYHPQKETFYLFANEAVIAAQHSSKPQESIEKGYYLKILYRMDYVNHTNTNMIQFSAPTYVCLPPVHSNDDVQLFAHISSASFGSVDFNWFIQPWEEVFSEIEYN